MPGRCADRLSSGEVDLALIPSIEYALHTGYRAVPGLCIACDGPAASVLMISRRPPQEVRSVGLDPASRTSAALLKILFHERWKTDPVFAEAGGDIARALTHHDALLVIGDRALFGVPELPSDVVVTDLGQEWKDLTRLPFVFAFWAGRGDAVEDGDVTALDTSLEAGLANLPEIARAHTWGGRPYPETSLAYVRDVMRYRWGQAESDGLLRFYLLAARHGLIGDVPEISFYGEPVTGRASR